MPVVERLKSTITAHLVSTEIKVMIDEEKRRRKRYCSFKQFKF